MNNFSIIEVADNKWSDIISKSMYSDFYHTQSYHMLEKENRPVLLVVDFKDDFIALPLILREIPNSEYFDCTSVYGYCGPISNLNFDTIPNEYFVIFKQELSRFFKESNIVTAFSRLHPIISHGKLFENFGTVKDINKTVAIDLRISPEDQKKQYRKSNKSELNQLRRKGFEVIEAQTKVEVDAFVSIYHETMSRVDASENYFFDYQYFYNFLDNKCFRNKLLLAKKDGIIVAGAIFTITNTIMQYHLAGTTKEFIKETPMKLILDEARLIGNDLKLDFLHLGGGVGGSDEDSLFKFKSGFSNKRSQFKIWQFIANQNKYNQLVFDNKITVENDFFPLYRSNSSKKVILYGASGHCKVIIDILNLKNILIKQIVDDNQVADSFINIPVVHSKEFSKKDNLIIAIGDNLIRKKLSKKNNATYFKLIHPQTLISPFARIEKGTVVMAGVIINSNCKIGLHCIINTQALIEHDCIIDNFVHISPKVTLAGNVTVGEGTHIGIGTCVIPGIKIGKWVTIGAGTVIIQDVPDYAVIVGNPGRIIKFNTPDREDLNTNEVN